MWESHVNAVEEGNSYLLSQFHVREYQQQKYLSMTKLDSKISAIEPLTNVFEPPLEADKELSTCIYNAQGIGAPHVDVYHSCLTCRARVEPSTPPHGKCTKCDMVQLYDLCHTQSSARVLIRYVDLNKEEHRITLSAFGDIVYQLSGVQKNHPITPTDLVSTYTFPEIHYMTNKKIITVVVRETK